MTGNPPPARQRTQQAQGEAGPGGGTDAHHGDVGSQRPAWCRELTMLSVCPRRSVPPSSTRCGCSGGGGSMARVWGATAPARLALLLLLTAMCSQETCAAPWRAPAADDGASYPDDGMKAAFVPQGKPRGPLGELRKPNPVPESGLDARGVGGVKWSPASQLSSRTEAPATRIGPGEWKVAWIDGKYSKRLSHVLLKIMKKAAYGVEDEGRANATEDQVLLKYCLALTAAFLVSMLAAMITCCLLIRRWRQRKQRLAAADGAQHDVRGHSLPSSCSPQGAWQMDMMPTAVTTCPLAGWQHQGGPCQT